MKVLHVIPSLGPLRGGPSFALSAMSKGLSSAGVDVHIATTDDNGAGRLDVSLAQPILEDGVTRFYFPRQTQIYTGSRPLSVWLRKHTHQYDLLHIHSLFSYSSTIAGNCARRANVPYIVRPLGHLNQWGMTKRRRIAKQVSLRLVEKRLLRGATLINYTSEREREQASLSGINYPSFVLPLGLDLQKLQKDIDKNAFLDRYPLLQGRFVFLFLARLDVVKGLDLLLPAFAELRRQHPEAVLVLAGDGEEAFVHQLQNQIKTMNLEKSVLLTGFLEGDDKIMALRSADAFVLPSYSENFANAPVEAMALGLPVIVSDQVGVAATIRKAEAGLIVPCRVEELRTALESLVVDSRLRQQLGAKGEQLVKEQFTIQATTRTLIDYYEEVLHHHSKHSTKQL